MILRHRLAAVEEAEEIIKWLHAWNPTEADRFAEVFDMAMQEIASNPDHWPRFECALELTPDRDVRRFIMRPFPHMVLYEIKGEFVVILAVMHPSRDPTYWLDRLD